MDKKIAMMTAVLAVSTVSSSSLWAGDAAARGARRAERQAERKEAVEQRLEEKKPTASPGVNKRQRRQGSRIVGGVKSGQLNEAEMTALTAREARLRELEAGMKADGTLTEAERRALHGEMSQLSKDIRAEKHDLDHAAPLQLRTGMDTRQGAAAARRLVEVRRQLNTPDLPAATRQRLETEHQTLVDSLYEEAGD